MGEADNQGSISINDYFSYDLSPFLSLKDSFDMKLQGSEAKIYEGLFLGRPAILKERFIKRYRHPDLDKSLTSERMRSEVRALNKCQETGIPCPSVYFVDLTSRCIILQHLTDCITVKDYLLSYTVDNDISSLHPLATKIGEGVGKMHANSLVHGDLTTSNMLLKKDALDNIPNDGPFDVFFIDFGLSKRDVTLEDCAVDLYVLERAISSSHPDSEVFFEQITRHYRNIYCAKSSASEAADVAVKLEEVRQRGRKRTMVG